MKLLIDMVSDGRIWRLAALLGLVLFMRWWFFSGST